MASRSDHELPLRDLTRILTFLRPCAILLVTRYPFFVLIPYYPYLCFSSRPSLFSTGARRDR
jgi:hypothetical protein